jgi:hypothetical protein
MKNIAYSLCMIFLFGILCPSYQAYAKGSEVSIGLEKIRVKKILNNDLIDKLAASKVFEQFYYKTFIFSAYASLNAVTKSEKELQIESKKVEKLSNKNAITSNDVSEIYETLGFKYDAGMQNFLAKTHELTIRLSKEFPELGTLNKDEVEFIMQSAITKANLEAKATMELTKDECFKNARVKYYQCISYAFWCTIAFVALGAVCLAAFIACLVIAGLIETATAAVTTSPIPLTFSVAFARLLLPYALSCVTFAAGALGVQDYSTPYARCNEELNSLTANCVAEFGPPNSVGAN